MGVRLNILVGSRSDTPLYLLTDSDHGMRTNMSSTHDTNIGDIIGPL